MRFGSGTGPKTLLWAIVGTCFLSVLFLGLFHAPMSMAGEPSGCPFMSHEEVLCSMGALEHLSAWKAAFSAIVPTFGLFLLGLALAAVTLAIVSDFQRVQRFTESPLIRLYLHDRIHSVLRRPLQELFASGLLHPKVF